jgi:translation initiation factor IF-2
MSSFRIHDIAKELNITSAEVLKICRKLELDIKSHSSAINTSQRDKIIRHHKNYEDGKVTISISGNTKEFKPVGMQANILDRLKVKRTVFLDDRQQEEEQVPEPEKKPRTSSKSGAKKTKPMVRNAVEIIEDEVIKEDLTEEIQETVKQEPKVSRQEPAGSGKTDVIEPEQEKTKKSESIPKTAPESVIPEETAVAPIETGEPVEVEVSEEIEEPEEAVIPEETGYEEELPSKKSKLKAKLPDSHKSKNAWDEEKKINIRMVLDKELDKEEKEGKLKPRVKHAPSKKGNQPVGAADIKSVRSVEAKVTDQKEIEIKRPEIKKVIELPENMTVKQLSEKIGVASEVIIQKLFNMGEIYTINQTIDRDIIEILSQEFNFKYKIINFDEEADESYQDNEKDLLPKPPIVTVMGHVDHGKTTLLDAIRKADVAPNEAGGITQSIGAYQTVYNDKKITFIDTPGHEAFTMMRARGAKVTDIAIIVVAADDGIMPQTIEAINHAKDAKVPIIIAVNKIDIQDANPDKVKQGMTEFGLVPEEWGGDTIFVSISAKNKQNISDLLEVILLVAEMNDIKGNPNAEGSGIIIESKLDKNLGPIGTVLIKRGKIKVGDYFVTGNSFGRIRVIKNEKGELLENGEISQPVEISGFNIVPQAGDKFFVVKNEKMAKDIINKREDQKKLARSAEAKKHITLEDLAEMAKGSEAKRLKVILKSESNGSMDAVEKAIKDIEEGNIKIDLIHKAVGAILDSDILLATASDAIVIGFGVVATTQARLLAKEEKVEIRTYNIIYKLVDDIRLAIKGMLEPVIEEKIKGTVEIREVFKLSKAGTIAGCYVLDGEIERGNPVRIIRDGRVIYDGKIDSLHRFKEDMKKVSAGYECGIKIENYQDLNKGDTLEVYEKRVVPI